MTNPAPHPTVAGLADAPLLPLTSQSRTLQVARLDHIFPSVSRWLPKPMANTDIPKFALLALSNHSIPEDHGQAPVSLELPITNHQLNP